MTDFKTTQPIAALVLALLVSACDGPGRDTAAQLSSQAVADNNRAVGLMGQYDYTAAREVFAELVQANPQVTAMRLNLAIATMNRQQDGDEAAALEMVNRLLADEPDNDRAQYCAGLLTYRAGDFEAAARHLGRVSEQDPRDAHAAYFLGETLAQQGRPDEALRLQQQAIAADPYLRSAWYAAFRLYRQQGDNENAQKMFDHYRRLENNPRASVVEFKYTRMGHRCEAVTLGEADMTSIAAPTGALFEAPVALEVPAAQTISNGNITAADINGDGRVDLFVSGRGTRNIVMLATGDGGYRAAADHPLAAVSNVNTALWGDYDNDGLLDVYLCRRGANSLWRQSPAGQWSDVTAATGTAGGELNTVDGAMLDADHDGDLDLFLVNGDGPDELLNNNLDGSFRPIAAQQGIAGAERPSRSVVVIDLDNDRDTDIVVLHTDPPLRAHVNHLTWEYRDAVLPAGLLETPALALAAADTDADGNVELYALADRAVRRWQQGPQGDWTNKSFTLPGELSVTSPQPRMALVDVNGDGRPELLLSHDTGWAVLGIESENLSVLYKGELAGGDRVVDWLPLVEDPGRGPSLAALDASGRLWRWAPGPGRFRFAAMEFRGKEAAAESMRSNYSGIGTRYMARIGSRWVAGDSFRRHSGPGQDYQPQLVGLAGNTAMDFVSLTWSDGVLQTELNLASGELHSLHETERQLASCPILFAWDGEQYRFVSDLLGVGGIGFAVGPREYATPRPWENFLMPAGSLAARDGRFEIKITEPMEEVAYLDAARLVSYDLPPGWQMVLDERMGIGDPAPTGRALFYRDEILPESATNERGEDVTDKVIEADHTAAPVGELDRRFLGMLRSEHVLTLQFDEALHAADGQLLLVVDGWVEYPYSQTSFAAWQAGASWSAPTLEARGADGNWHGVLVQFGYPAGMPRRMAVPLPTLPAGTRELRLRTNMEIYWDRVSVARAGSPDGLRRNSLPLVAARVAAMGFPLRSNGPQRLPGYDYRRRAPYWDTRHAAGYYTAFGDATALVSDTDDAVAIIGPGEQVHMEFAAASDPPPAGWSRFMVLETNGWAKDMDMYTRDGTTVGPLPTRAEVTGELRDSLHAQYNTRYRSGY